MTTPLVRAISLGAGVQSTTLALMAAHGEIGPMPDCAIFADTGWEPEGVYDHLRWLTSPNVLPFPVHIVSAGDIRADTLAKTNTTGQRFASIPWFLRTVTSAGTAVPVFDEDEAGELVQVGERVLSRDEVTEGMVRRQCTKEYKLRPVQRKIVELLGGRRPKGGAEVWIGISADEAWRMKPSRVQYIQNRHPLLEARISRRECFDWLDARGYPVVRPEHATRERPQWPPKSSCLGCPFHDDAQWTALTPEEFKDAVEVDRAIRDQPGMRGQQFMHRSLKPLEEVDFSTPADRGQLNLFLNECEGMCGV